MDEKVWPSGMKEGWGITQVEDDQSADGNYRLYISDSTSTMFEVDGDTLETIRSFTVT